MKEKEFDYNEKFIECFELCTIRNIDCNNCKYDKTDFCGISRSEVLEFMKNQRREINNLIKKNEKLYGLNMNLIQDKDILQNENNKLTEENRVMSHNLNFHRDRSLSFQKQVDELNEQKQALIRVCDNCPKVLTDVEQAVKDTAKEICDLILKHWEKKQFVECDWLRVAISERYGVEVE